MTSSVLPYWFWHALEGSFGLLLMIVISLTGAMLRGRLPRPAGVNVFKVHRIASIAFVPLMAIVYLHGQYVTTHVGFGLPHTTHGWIGLAIVVLGLIQLTPSLLVRARKRLRASHMAVGYLIAALLFVQTFWGLQVGLVGSLKPLVLLHSLGGAAAAFALIWVLVELRRSTPGEMARARTAAYTAAFANVAGCWIAGGYSYLTDYGQRVKPVILDSATPWAHLVITEAKEHVFIFIPTLSVLLALMLRSAARDDEIAEDPIVRRSLGVLAALALAMVLLMFVFGALISSAGRIGAGGTP